MRQRLQDSLRKNIEISCETERDECKNSSLFCCISKPIDFKFEMWYTPSLPLKKLKKESQSRNKQRKSVRYDVKTAYSEFDKIAPQSYSHVDIIDL